MQSTIKEYSENHVTLLDHAFKVMYTHIHTRSHDLSTTLQGLIIHSQSPHLPFILLVSLTMYKHLVSIASYVATYM